MEKHVENIVQWLRDQVNKAGVNGLVVGVSGGLDSAVVAHLIKRAFPDDSLGVLMPIHTKETDLNHAKKVVEGCDISSLTIDLSNTHQTMYDQIKNQLMKNDTFIEQNDQLADANLRARLRMSTLYALATNYNYLVVGTDNAAEWYTGYFTKYGDGGADILPLVDFTKQEVRDMAAYLGVPVEVAQKKPSADLWEGQTDESEMGTTYDKIDAYINGEEIPEKDKEVIESLHRRTEHKRNPLPQYKRNK
ncbi:NAD(+) synthase [Virgibacillus halodenitrificans]|uniref:NH(3)-dependent NAD(+) synthetase n=1 Tax=Virgibacillus halodenitrificans TaxID=1482 RepID=A0AAC9NL06_VIRHA|nr:NAD(+) synthase [Virgibacillus halodenitrificans]APC48146.1 NAD(+) synthase [Virgibacillus halodenitrificans]MCG1027918.1 NAD(+) synthase [Virgibacillus halodenitrificans]MCJ0930742.1 NAD(+) synthase [Virgibacillus halodenitrificans]MEC2159974.1 NAD(+) synthase [Virgibacillus halodenitrificans]MYL44919.1 NAD(+) synthase [Virgibacillus halodenitrificans]